MALLVAASIIPVIGKALALKSRCEKLADGQLFIALGAAQTDASSLQRSLPALEREVAALQLATTRLHESLGSWRHVDTFAEVRDLRTKFHALINALR